jgi:hypothetical protein
MTEKNNRKTTEKGFPIDDRPIVFNIINNNDTNFVGRYIESESIFMTSLNDDGSDFVSEKSIDEWHYIDEHPKILSEVLNKKTLDNSINEKNKFIREKSEFKESDDSIENTKTHIELPVFLKTYINNLQEQLGTTFGQVNVRVVGEDDLNDLPVNILEQILEQAIQDENFELATKIRNAINSK